MKKFLFALPLLVAASFANANSVVYVSGGLGAGGLSSDNTNVGAHATFGTNALVPNVGFEVAFRGTAAGKMEDEDNKQPDDYLGATGSFILAAKPYYMAGPFQFWGKVGLNSWNAEYKSGADKDQNSTRKSSGTDFMYGVGMDVFMGQTFALGVSYDNYTFDKVNADSINLNLSLHFG
ncbi:outer membrane beta-barrel protein [Vibrio sp. SCSIO 43136]|uniref:outer membrane beta-barrel protein n=1 Tax=Vibrio sp. SCSIO 43136 TaxID=2819101 RepID=UPI002075C655|nr:outer membrane beta-barrel protein [Vibrio sp. SCSIO 43136]USD66273.1 outer membrane beta-barrel protein [Vibrio sp. SCSIO 43136]